MEPVELAEVSLYSLNIMTTQNDTKFKPFVVTTDRDNVIGGCNE